MIALGTERILARFSAPLIEYDQPFGVLTNSFNDSHLYADFRRSRSSQSGRELQSFEHFYIPLQRKSANRRAALKLLVNTSNGRSYSMSGAENRVKIRSERRKWLSDIFHNSFKRGLSKDRYRVKVKELSHFRA